MQEQGAATPQHLENGNVIYMIIKRSKITEEGRRLEEEWAHHFAPSDYALHCMYTVCTLYVDSGKHDIAGRTYRIAVAQVYYGVRAEDISYHVQIPGT